MSHSFFGVPVTASVDTGSDFDIDEHSLPDGTSEDLEVSHDQTPFRFRDLPAELRMRIYALLIPHHVRLALDPANIVTPGAFVDTKNHHKILPLLLVSKGVYAEVVPLLYATNTFCLIKPLASDKALSFVGPLALGSIQKLEIQVSDGMVDLGTIWDDLTLACDLKTLKLVFYHDEENWLDCLADLALMPNPKPTIDLQLYKSIWADPDETSITVRAEIDEAFEVAERRRKVVRYTGLPKAKHITISASVNSIVPFAFLTYTRNGQLPFEARMDKETDLRTCLRLKA